MNIKRGLITIAIAVIFALFIGYGIEVFHDSPKQEEFCPNVYDILNKEECETAGGLWRVQSCAASGIVNEGPASDSESREETEVRAVKPVPAAASAAAQGYCETRSACYEDFQLIMSRHDKIVFIVAAIFGVLAIIAGMILKKEGVNDGFVAGGILLILYGTIRYWQHADDVLKFVLLGLVLGALVWIGYKKLDQRRDKKPDKK